jgi:redox-sensitive bicupin YhaK (pirin superfamily)
MASEHIGSVFRSRKISKIVSAVEMAEGEGVIVQQAIPLPTLSQVDPFLLIHEMGPLVFVPHDNPKGVPDHPHRGFETVSYILDGEIEHRDSSGSHGYLRAGDAQRMTAGRGVVHSEKPSDAFRQKGGRLHGFQIWVNLPQKLKMSAPHYQEVASADLPSVQIPGMNSRVKVIVGEFMGEKSPIQTTVPSLILDFELGSGAEIVHRIPVGWSALAYVYENSGRFGPESQSANELVVNRQMAIFSDEGDGIRIVNEAVSPALRFLLLAGERLNEPMARYGPFVMNTPEEVEKAFQDYQTGKF